MKKILLSIFISTLCYSAQVEFTAKGHPSALTIHGRGDCLSVLKGGFLDIQNFYECDMDKLTTGIGTRDEHMKKYLEIEKFPNSSYSTKDSTLVLHGVKRRIDVKKDGNVYTFEIKMSDFGIKQPNYLGISIDDLVQVKVTPLP